MNTIQNITPEEGLVEKPPSFVQRIFKNKRQLLAVGGIVGLLIIVGVISSSSGTNSLIGNLPRSAKTYSVSQFNPNQTYPVDQGDTIMGMGAPNGNVTVLVSPNIDKKEIVLSQSGQWQYSLPKDAAPGIYHFSVLLRDNKNKLTGVKTYTLNII